MRDYWMFATTIALILAGILFNRQDYKDLRAEINQLRSEMNSKFDALRTEIYQEFREFYRTLGQHDAKIEHLEKERE